MQYRIEISEKAREQLALSRKTCAATLGSAWKQCATIFAATCGSRDKGNRYRLRIGTFRVLFVLAGNVIQVYAVKDRKEAYD